MSNNSDILTAWAIYRREKGDKASAELMQEALEDSATPEVVRVARRLAHRKTGIKGLGVGLGLEVLAAVGRELEKEKWLEKS